MFCVESSRSQKFISWWGKKKNKKTAEEKRWYVSAHGHQCALVLLVLITPNTHTYLVDCSEGPIRRAGQVTGQEKSVLKSVAIYTMPQRDGVL